MDTIVIFEDAGYRNLLPLTYWRAVWELRVGYGPLVDHARHGFASADVHFFCRSALTQITADRFQRPVHKAPNSDRAIYINGRLLLTEPIHPGPLPAVQWHDDAPVVIHADRICLDRLTTDVLLDPIATQQALADLPSHRFIENPRLINYPWDLVHANADMLNLGWQRTGGPAECLGRICDGVHLLNVNAIHIGRGTTVKPGVVLDAEKGPIYIGDDVTISPNVSIEGPCYIGNGSLIQPGAALRDAMSIGRCCKVGGELESSIIHGYSNKQHDGFLGHSYVAEWVNLAADTVNSDLKSTYGTVRVPINGIEVESGQIFVGLTIGDHSKTGIGQMFPTGAVVGFGSNVATCEFAPKFVPSFSWLTNDSQVSYDLDRCLAVAQRVMARRQVTMTAAEETLFHSLPTLTNQIETPLD